MSKSSKKVLDKCYALVEDWAYGSAIQIVPLLEVLKQYDEARFFGAMKAGYERGIKSKKENDHV